MRTQNFLKLREVNYSIALFADLTNLPKVVGAIDGSHVKIRAPTASDSAPDYFGPHQKHDYITQAKVDDKNNYVDFACGIPRSMYDARVLGCSAIFQRTRQGDNLSQLNMNVK